MHAHRDHDVFRFAVAQRAARAALAAKAPGQPKVTRTKQGVTMTASAKRDGSAGLRALIQKARAA
jgi:hypothetical protein